MIALKMFKSTKVLKALFLILILGALLLGNEILWAIETNSQDLSTTSQVALTAGKFLVKFAFWLIIGALVLAGLYRLGSELLSLFEGQETEDTNETKEAAQIVTSNLRGIESVLGRLDLNRESASERIREAQAYSDKLLKAISSAMRRYEHQTERVESFTNALTALASTNPKRIAESAGRIEDNQLRALMLELLKNKDAQFSARLEEMIAAQLGVCSRNAAAYRRLALQTMPQLTEYKVTIERLLAMHDAYDLAEPILMISEQLRQAQAYLELPMRESIQIRTMPVAMIEE